MSIDMKRGRFARTPGEVWLILLFGLALLIPVLNGAMLIGHDRKECEKRGGIYVKAVTSSGFACIAKRATR